MKRAVFLALAGFALAGTPEDDAWERRVIGMFIQRGDEIARVQVGHYDAEEDRQLIQLLAAYGGFKAQGRGLAFRPSPRSLDSLEQAGKRAELAFLVRMRNFQPALARLSSGAPPAPSDSLLVRSMANYIRMRMEAVTPLAELGR